MLGCGADVHIINRKRLLHAKCYGAHSRDGDSLVVTSGNFTGPGMSQNVEMSVLLDQASTAAMKFSWGPLNDLIGISPYLRKLLWGVMLLECYGLRTHSSRSSTMTDSPACDRSIASRTPERNGLTISSSTHAHPGKPDGQCAIDCPGCNELNGQRPARISSATNLSRSSSVISSSLSFVFSHVRPCTHALRTFPSVPDFSA